MKGRLLYLFPDRAVSRITEVQQGLVPGERLYGLLEMRERGWDAVISDARWEQSTSGVRRQLKNYFELPNLSTIHDMKEADVVVVKDEFSTTLLLEARLANRPLVYLDAMFDPPRTFRRRRAAAFNLKRADAVCCYSRCQAEEWAKSFALPLSRFEILPYCIDVDFYPQLARQTADPPYVISVGRDLGRDYATMIAACEAIGINLKLVTLPYLIPDSARVSPRVEVLQNLSYPQLFHLYAGASMAVVPLKSGITYPSGIRALLESAAIGVPTVVSETLVLPEYLRDQEHVRYCLPENVESLVDAMQTIINDQPAAEAMAQRCLRETRERFSTYRFVDLFEQIIADI